MKTHSWPKRTSQHFCWLFLYMFCKMRALLYRNMPSTCFWHCCQTRTPEVGLPGTDQVEKRPLAGRTVWKAQCQLSRQPRCAVYTQWKAITLFTYILCGLWKIYSKFRLIFSKSNPSSAAHRPMLSSGSTARPGLPKLVFQMPMNSETSRKGQINRGLSINRSIDPHDLNRDQ